MGLKLRLNLFYEVEARDVFGSFKGFYQRRGQDFVGHGDQFSQFTLHEPDHRWTVLSLDGGWEWDVRRQAQFHISRELACQGFLIFVYDGDYWGYEFFQNGIARDHFLQQEEICSGIDWFPGKACQGYPGLIAEEFPQLGEATLADYLMRDPLWTKTDRELTTLEFEARSAEHRSLDVPVRAGDEFTRFDECAVLDFLRYLGVRVELRDHYVSLSAPVFRSFWISGQNYLRRHFSEEERETK